jgi:hypothetical protein
MISAVDKGGRSVLVVSLWRVAPRAVEVVERAETVAKAATTADDDANAKSARGFNFIVGYRCVESLENKMGRERQGKARREEDSLERHWWLPIDSLFLSNVPYNNRFNGGHDRFVVCAERE